ncbi:hypothetical protein [Sphingomonas sanxanigenens]|uniref:Uncharacterized protein n=1 Tax=Sphingomonas sanxanigenens DSM 19645 = NX02 TaxID=1123269 RepID=W0AHT3_9SPHN|nr:hypothetical protein [Sphingomonas sanxanigenens]AHE55858.1 hypothetical protein NX02_21090 [Sphingomonas sanxanigenens DSM 19645 = NX02]
MTDVDRAVARAGDYLHRTRGNARLAKRSQQRRRERARARLGLTLSAILLIAVGTIGWGLAIGPIGLGGLFLSLLLMVVAAGVIIAWPSGADGAPPTAATELARLPLQTEDWLASQRPALPAPAVNLVDGIGLKLETLSTQLNALDEREPAALQIRKLVGDDLPELVRGWQRVPEPMRREERNGMTPDRQLVEGLQVVDGELKRISEQIAAGDLDKLAVQEKFLQLKYRGDPELEG